jgi:hypothetical protein
MINFDATYAAELLKEAIADFILVSFDFSTPVYVTDSDVPVLYDSNLYLSRDITYDSLTISAALSVDKTTLEIDNADRQWSGYLLAADQRGKNVVISRGLRIPSNTAGVPITSGAVTLTNTKLSLVDGTAFVDFSTADVLTNYIGKILTITDSAGKRAIGWIKAAGTGETYDSNIVSNGNVESGTTGWSPGPRGTGAQNADAHDGSYSYGVTVNAGSSDTYYGKTISPTQDGLYKVGIWAKNSSSTGITLQLNAGEATGYKVIGESTATAWAEISGLWTCDGSPYVYGYVRGSEKVGLVDDLYLQQILTPSATGVTIVSAQGGSAYNWQSIESGFNPNDSSGYTYTISESAPTVYVEPVFYGILDGWRIRGKKVSITVVNELILWNKKALRTSPSSCPWAFKQTGGECGYAGGETWCDQSWERCCALSNQLNFGGERFINAIMEKEIWWGRTPKV